MNVHCHNRDIAVGDHPRQPHARDQIAESQPHRQTQRCIRSSVAVDTASTPGPLVAAQRTRVGNLSGGTGTILGSGYRRQGMGAHDRTQRCHPVGFNCQIGHE